MKIKHVTATALGVALAGAGGIAFAAPATAAETNACTPSGAWTEHVTHDAFGQPTITVDNPAYVPAVEEVSHTVHHDAVGEPTMLIDNPDYVPAVDPTPEIPAVGNPTIQVEVDNPDYVAPTYTPGYYEHVPASYTPPQGEKTITVDNPDYVPATPGSPEVPEVSHIVHHEAVTHPEYRYKTTRSTTVYTVEHKEIKVPTDNGKNGPASRVISWLNGLGVSAQRGAWAQIPDATVAAAHVNPFNVATTGSVGLSAYGGPNVTVSYRITSIDAYPTPTTFSIPVTTSTVLYYTGPGNTLSQNQGDAAWARQAPSGDWTQFDERTVTDKDAWDEKVIDQEFVPAVPGAPAIGEPTIEVDNPDYVPAVYIPAHDVWMPPMYTPPVGPKTIWVTQDNPDYVPAVSATPGSPAVGEPQIEVENPGYVAAWDETVIDVEAADAIGEPTITIDNPAYVPASVEDIEHAAITCEITPTTSRRTVTVTTDSELAETGGDSTGLILAGALGAGGLAAGAGLLLTRRRRHQG